MKRHILVSALALCSCAGLFSTQEAHAQSAQGVAKLEQVAKQLKLTPQQKAQLIPILAAEAPKLEAIKSDTSLSRIQKLQQLKAVHDQTAPQVKAILTPQQYEKLQEIRRQEIQQALKKKAQQY